MDGSQEVAADPKEILHGAVHREKPLRVGRRCEPAHLTLPLPGHAGASATTVIATAIIVAGFVIDSSHRMWLRPPELIEKAMLEGLQCLLSSCK